MSAGALDAPPMRPLPITVHADADALAGAVAAALARAIGTGIAAHGEAWLALAGGSTPLAAYRMLAAMDLPWAKVHLIASDERWVDARHEKRNERALAAAFAAAGGVTVHPLVPADAAIARFEACIGKTTGAHELLRTAATSLAPLAYRGFDAVLLGMGADAHFASLFPQVTPAAALDAGSREAVVAITPKPLPPEAPYPRISLTLSRLLAAHSLLLMIRSESKRRVLEEARSRPVHEAPIHALLTAAPDLAIHWSP